MVQVRIPVMISISLMLLIAFNPLLGSGVEAWTDGNKDSPVYPHYGIVDMLVDQAYREFNATYPEKAEYLRYWYLWDGADSDPDSFDLRVKVATPDDNFLAWTDDDAANDGDKANYFIHNSKGWEMTDAPTTAQQWANWSVQNLTKWFMQGKPEVSDAKHKAAYCAARMSRYISKMAQYGRTDYSQWDQVNSLPEYDPNEVSYQKYYEAYLWNDASMTELVKDFRNRTFDLPTGFNATDVHTQVADAAKHVNSRDGTAVTMIDHDGSEITVGKTYKEMLYQFMYCWDNDIKYNQTVRGFNGTLWELTLENMVLVAENLSAIYGALYDRAQYNFIETAPDVAIIDHSYEPEEVIANDMVTVNATVKNIGPTSTRGTILVEISTSTGFANTRPIALEPFEEKNVTFSPFRAGTSDLWVRIKADSEEIMAEPNEADNEVQFEISPIPEVFASELELAVPFPTIRRDTVQPIELLVHNNGNRYDEFTISGNSTLEDVFFIAPEDPVGVGPNSTVQVQLFMATLPETDLGQVSVDISAEGTRSVSEIQITVEVLDRSQEPVPRISGPDWTRVGMDITLSAEGSTDPDGDALYFNWLIPEWGNYTGPQVTFNYTRVGSYDIVLEVFDGNLTVESVWTIEVHPLPPENLSSYISSRGVSSITVTWSPWKAGGLIAYWLEASVRPGEEKPSERGPFSLKVPPGTTTGRIGGFYPETDVEVRVKVQTEDESNRTMDVLISNTTGTDGFRSAVNMYLEFLDSGPYLYLQYKPWTQPEVERVPKIHVERWSGGFTDLPTEDMEIVQTTRTMDTVRYPLKADWGLYRVSLTYMFLNGSVSAFQVVTEYEKTNTPPEAQAINFDKKWELNVNGTCYMHVVLEVLDPKDHITIEADWGDGTSSTTEWFTSSNPATQIDIYHNYTEAGFYDVSLKIIDWSGDVSWVNQTVEVHEYSPPRENVGLSMVLLIIIAIVAIIFIVAMLIFLGRAAYRFAKKDTEVEFDMEQLGSRKKEKAGTGTDFDLRRNMQIPQESIMGGAKDRSEDPGSEDTPVVDGRIVFDDEE